MQQSQVETSLGEDVDDAEDAAASLEVDGAEHVPDLLPAQDGLQALVLDVGQEGVLAARRLLLLVAVKIPHWLLVLIIDVPGHGLHNKFPLELWTKLREVL